MISDISGSKPNRKSSSTSCVLCALWTREVSRPSSFDPRFPKETGFGQTQLGQGKGGKVYDLDQFEPGFSFSANPDAHPAAGISDLKFDTELKEYIASHRHQPGVPGTSAYGPLLPGQRDFSVGSRSGAAADTKAAAKYADSLENLQSQLSAARSKTADLRAMREQAGADTSLIDGRLAHETKQADLLEMRVKQMERAKAYSERMGTLVDKPEDAPWILKGPSLYRRGEPGRTQDFGIQPSTIVSSQADRDVANARTAAAEQSTQKAYGEGLLGKTKDEDEIDKINARIAGVSRVTAAQVEGAEAVRKAELESKYAEMEVAKVKRQFIDATRTEDEEQHQKNISAEANKRVTIFKDQLESLQEQRAVILDQIGDGEKTADQARALRDIENDRLKILVQQSLARRGATDGVRAFFFSMKEDAQSAASIIYDAMHLAVDKSSNEVANLLTGKKTNFGRMFTDIGHQMLQSLIETGIQTGLGALGSVRGVNKVVGLGKKKAGPLGSAGGKFSALAGVGKPDGSSPQLAFWVRMSQPQLPSPGASQGILSGLLSGLGALLSGGASAGEAVSSTITYGGELATGGGVSPGSAYMVGERGPEMFMPSSRGTIVPHDRLGGGNHHYYNVTVEAGVDPAVFEEGMARAIRAVHDMQRRMPGGSRS